MKTILNTRAMACVAILLGAGCGPMDELSTGQAFLEAFPVDQTLLIPAGEDAAEAGEMRSMSQALVGDRADLHDLSFYVAYQINSQAHSILRTIWFITRFQPSLAVEEEGVIGEGDNQIITDARAVWGPFPDNEGKNLEFILHVWRGTDPDDGRRTYVYYAAGRTRGSDEGWIPFVFGGAKPAVTVEGERLDRVGLVEVDCDAVRALDPTEDDVGSATYAYRVGNGHHAVAAVGEGVWTDSTHTTTADATCFYGRSGEGYAVMEFDTSVDLEDDDGDALEDLHVVTGWLANGDGRSDAGVAGGDLTAGGATLTECWGRDKRQTYFNLTTPAGTIEDGTPDACFAARPIQVPAIDYQAIRDLFDIDF